MKLQLVFLLAGFFLGGALAAKAAEGRPSANTILAIVGDSVITREQVREAIRIKTDLPTLDEGSLYLLFRNDTPEVARNKALRMMEAAFESLISRELVLQEYKALEKKGSKVPESYIDEKIRQKIGSDRVQFARELEKMGKSFEQFREEMKDEIIYGTMILQFVPDPIISPNKIETYYTNHPDEFRVDEKVKLRMISMRKSETSGPSSPRGKMEDIASLLKSGSDFKELQKSYSDSPSGENDPPPSWRDLPTLDESIRKGIAGLQPGESSGVIELADRYVILRLEDRQAGHAQPVEEARVVIENKLRDEEKNHRLEEWFKRLESKILVRKF
jgi:parvulin-like peptidyl-prolyl isomerase